MDQRSQYIIDQEKKRRSDKDFVQVSASNISSDPTRELGKVQLNAGSNIVGKVGIDQTTPGTTNAVDVLDRAARDLGKVDIASLDQYTPETGRIPCAVKLVDESGNLYGVKHVNNKPRVSSMPYLYDIAEGNVSGHTPYYKLGYNGDVGATEEDIITQGGVYPWMASASALEVVSSSTDDDVAGIGVQKVKISYLDGDYAAASQVIDMDGTTPVPLTDTTILRVNSIRATQVGTSGMAVGTISCRLVGGAATVYRQIAVGYTRGRGLTYTVPLGNTLYVTSISVSSGYTTVGKVVRWTGRAQVDDTAPTVRIPFFQPFFEIITQDNTFHMDFDMPVAIPATADLKMSATSNGAGSFCSCGLRGWLE